MSALLLPAFSRFGRPALQGRRSGNEPGLSRVGYADTSGGIQKVHESLVIHAYTLIVLSRGQVRHLRTAMDERLALQEYQCWIGLSRADRILVRSQSKSLWLRGLPACELLIAIRAICAHRPSRAHSPPGLAAGLASHMACRA